MRRIALPVLLALLLAGGPAGASHRGTPTIDGLIVAGGVELWMEHEGTASGGGSTQREEERSRTHATYAFSSEFWWNLTLRLEAPAAPSPESPDLEGSGDAAFRMSGRLRETVHHERLDEEGKVIDSGDASGACTLHDDAPRHVSASAVLLPERSSILLALHYLGAYPGDGWTCGEAEDDYAIFLWPQGARLATDGLAPDVASVRALVNASVATRLGLRGNWNDVQQLQDHVLVELPIHFRPVGLQSERRVHVPTEADADQGRYCVEPAEGAEGSCTWRGVAEWQIHLDPCPPIRESLQEHLQRLREHPSPDASKGLKPLLAWRDNLHALSADVLADARSLALFCEDADSDAMALIAARTVEYQRALLELYRKGDRSLDLIRELAASERQLQLLGFEGAPGVNDIIIEAYVASRPPEGEVRVKVHSPVSIHAWTEDGAHVGWSDALGGPEIGIAGARYEGRPGEAQTIVLPAGIYRIAADEIAEGSYALRVEWSAEGVSGGETFPLDARDNRTFATHYALVEGAGGVEMERYPVARIATPAEFRFQDAPLRPAPGLADLPSAAQEGGGATPTTPSVGEGAEQKPLPNPALALLAVALAALARRHRAP